jgi:hypothetical protein
MSQNGKRKAEEVTAADNSMCITEFTKTSNVTVKRKLDRENEQYDIKLFHRRKPNIKKEPKTAFFVGTKAEADREAALFRVACAPYEPLHFPYNLHKYC